MHPRRTPSAMHSHSFFSVSARMYHRFSRLEAKQNSLLPTFCFSSSNLTTKSPFHRIYYCSCFFEILPIGTYVRSFNRFTDAAASIRIYYTLVCVSVSVHAHFLRFLSSPLLTPPTLLSYPPYLAYPSLISRIIDTGCYTCSMIGTSFRTNFFISLLHSFYID